MSPLSCKKPCFCETWDIKLNHHLSSSHSFLSEHLACSPVLLFKPQLYCELLFCLHGSPMQHPHLLNFLSFQIQWHLPLPTSTPRSHDPTLIKSLLWSHCFTLPDFSTSEVYSYCSSASPRASVPLPFLSVHPSPPTFTAFCSNLDPVVHHFSPFILTFLPVCPPISAAHINPNLISI